jgi:hypothetical protein
MSPELLAIFSGLVTALIIETIRYAFERNRIQESRHFERNKSLHAFMEYDESNREIHPIARLFISTPAEARHKNRIPKDRAREIISVQEIKIPIEVTSEKKNFWDKVLFWRRRKPILFTEVCRNYYREIPTEPDYYYFWDTRDRVELLGKITTIGRSAKNDIQLDSTLVSRIHSVIRFENDNFVFYNLAITNTIKVNDVEIDHNKILTDGDIIEFGGSYLIEFQQRNSSSPKGTG